MIPGTIMGPPQGLGSLAQARDTQIKGARRGFHHPDRGGGTLYQDS